MPFLVPSLLLVAPALQAQPAEVPPAPASTQPQAEADFVDVPGELVVSFKTAEAPADLATVVEAWNLRQWAPNLRVTDVQELLQWTRRGDASLTTVVVVQFEPATLDLQDLRAGLTARPAIDWAVPNRAYVGDPQELVPNDPQYASQYHHPLMQNDDAWNITLGDASIVIGVTDDGVAIDHPDLSPNIWTNTGEIANDGIDNDGNGYVDDVNGFDFSGGDNDPRPDTSTRDHGTHCAGISAARTDNGIGVAGTAGLCTIMPLQFYQGGGDWTATVIAETFEYAADNGANIVTTSYNMDGWAGDPIVTAGYDYMYDRGVLHFNSAGNGSSANPARQIFHQTMLVASTDSTDTKSGFSNWGTGIDISAPGSSVLSTVTLNGYDLKSGTSMASPNAAGVAALVWSQNPTWSRDQVAAQVYGTGDNIDAQNPSIAGLLGGGRVNSFRAVTEVLDAPKLVSAEGLPAEGGVLLEASIMFTLRFDKILDPATANDPTGVRLEYAGGDGVFGTADDTVVPLNRTEYLIGSNEQRFSLPAPVTAAGAYRVVASAQVLTDPFGAPIDGDGNGVGGDSFIRGFEVCGSTELFTDNAESGAGWSVQNQNLATGAWSVPPVVPSGGGARFDPPTDFDGSGRCFVTEDGSGNLDIDGGPTRLTSRAFDLSGYSDPYISFALWVNSSGSDDYVDVDISDNGGANWTPVERHGSFGGWRRITVRVADFVVPSSDVRLRWSAIDAGTPTVFEAGLDAIRGFVPNCGGPQSVGTEVCTSVPNSSGSGASIRGEGSAVVADNNFTLIASDAPPQQFGLFFSGRQLSGVFLGNGILCIGGNLTRLPIVQMDASGTVTTSLDLTSPAGAVDAVAGVRAYYQLWFRDPASGGAQSNLSTALEVDWL